MKVLVLMTSILLFASFSDAAMASPSYRGYKDIAANQGYGEKRPVANRDEAKKALGEYFSKKKVRIGEITEKELLFEAEILDKDGQVIDKVIIDKRTGRIRSIY